MGQPLHINAWPKTISIWLSHVHASDTYTGDDGTMMNTSIFHAIPCERDDDALVVRIFWLSIHLCALHNLND